MENDTCLNWLLALPGAGHELLAAVVGLARASVENNASTENTGAVLTDALRCIKGGDLRDCEGQTEAVRREKALLAPDCAVCCNPCGRTAEYPLEEFLSEDTALQEMKAAMLHALLEELPDAGPSGDLEGVLRRLFMFGYEKDAGPFASFSRELELS